MEFTKSQRENPSDAFADAMRSNGELLMYIVAMTAVELLYHTHQRHRHHHVTISSYRRHHHVMHYAYHCRRDHRRHELYVLSLSHSLSLSISSNRISDECVSGSLAFWSDDDDMH